MSNLQLSLPTYKLRSNKYTTTRAQVRCVPHDISKASSTHTDVSPTGALRQTGHLVRHQWALGRV